jgi:parallel beta-helix repeat protein
MRKDMAFYFILMLAAAFAFVACGGGSGGGVIPTKNLGDIQALYATNGTSWNDYVQGGDISDATDTACEAASDTACVHAGEVRMLELTGLSGCAGITAVDALGAFDWICDDSSGTATVISNGLATGSGLADLIDFSIPAWKNNRLTVSKDGSVYGASSSTPWWNNPVVANTAGGDLDGEGTVYVVPGSLNSVQYRVIANSVSLVAAPGVVINGPGADGTVISAGSKDFIWVEGMAINATGSAEGVRWDTVRFSVLRDIQVDYASTGVSLSLSTENTLSGVTANNNVNYGVHLNSSSGNTLSDVAAYNNVWEGVTLISSSNNTLSGISVFNSDLGVDIDSSDNNMLSDIGVINSGSDGIGLYSSSGNTLSGVRTSSNNSGLWLGSSSGNTLRDVTASNNSKFGIRLDLSSGNILSRVTTSNNAQEGLLLTSSDQNLFSGVTASNNTYGVGVDSSSANMLSGVTASNNSQEGIYVQVSSNANTFSGVTASNNANSGLWVGSSSGNTFSGLTASDNGMYSVDLSSCSNNDFTGPLKVGNNGDGNCAVSGGTNPGLVNGTCTTTGLTGSNTYGSGNISDATLTNSVSVTSSFIANITSDDPINLSDTSGIALFNSISDWTALDNPYRAWGIWNADDFPSANHRGRCSTGQDCQIWDWSMHANDAVIVNSLSYPGTGDISNTLTHTWMDASSTTFLRSAVEIAGDSIGNDNTLCESGEACMYTPNMGSYQGHGAIINATPAFTNGAALTGITLKKYETNGY